jgi:hypothetical protein
MCCCERRCSAARGPAGLAPPAGGCTRVIASTRNVHDRLGGMRQVPWGAAERLGRLTGAGAPGCTGGLRETGLLCRWAAPWRRMAGCRRGARALPLTVSSRARLLRLCTCSHPLQARFSARRTSWSACRWAWLLRGVVGWWWAECAHAAGSRHQRDALTHYGQQPGWQHACYPPHALLQLLLSLRSVQLSSGPVCTATRHPLAATGPCLHPAAGEDRGAHPSCSWARSAQRTPACAPSTACSRRWVCL